VGFLVAGPVSGWLSDRFGARPFATGGMVVVACLVAAVASLLRGKRYVHDVHAAPTPAEVELLEPETAGAERA